MLCLQTIFPALLFSFAFLSPILCVDQVWSDFAVPQRQTDVARSGLQVGNFGAFTDGVLGTTVISLQDLQSVPYNNEEIGPAQTHCPPNVTAIDEYFGYGVVQDDDLNVYATFYVYTASTTSNGYATYTIKVARSGNDFTPEWVTCTGNNETDDGDFYYNPALYKDSSNNTYVILRDYGNTQFALRTSDGGLEHFMEYEPWDSEGSVAITPDGVVLQPGNDGGNVFITSTDEPLSGTTFTLTEDQSDQSDSSYPIIRTMGSPNSFVTISSNDDVVFFDNLGQSDATTVLNGSSFGNILDLAGLKDGRVSVLHGNGPVATLTIVDYDGSNRMDVNISDEYSLPNFDNDAAFVCEGSDGNVYVLNAANDSCSLIRVDLSTMSSESIFGATGGDCSNDVGAVYLSANEEGVFFSATNGSDATFSVYGFQYESSAIQAITTPYTIGKEKVFSSGHLVPGAYVTLFGANSINVNTGAEPMMYFSAFSDPTPPIEASSDDDAAPALFGNNWMGWF